MEGFESGKEATDLRRWKLKVDEGRQVWHYIDGDEPVQQSLTDKYTLGLLSDEDVPPTDPASTPLEAAEKAVAFYQQIQSEDGHWAMDYGGPMFLMPGLLIACHVTGVELPRPVQIEMVRYLTNRQNADGGWGLHIESPSTIFGTGMNYTAMRLLGVPMEDDRMKRAREFLAANDGCKGIPSWGKFWLAVMGVYDWEGLHPIPPELWLLPYMLPIHPGRWWCHCRMVYLPMGYVYGRRITAPESPLVLSLRKELYPNDDYAKINWYSIRSYVSPLDLYYPHSTLLECLYVILDNYEKVHSSWLREKSVLLTAEHVAAEDKFTDWVCIGPVNKTINMLCSWHAQGKDSKEFQRHVDRVPDYLWLAEDGMKMQGYNGSQLWDTAFSVQAIIETGLGDQFQECLQKAYSYIDITQVREDVEQMEYFYRHISKGAWPFSTRHHGWPISDCTAEGLKASLLLKQFSWVTPFEDQRYFDAVNVILSLQNSDGGWATYELQRGPSILEYINPAEVFDAIMVDYPYVECTSACVQALTMFVQHYPRHRATEITTAVKKAVDLIKSKQRPDGSWYGSWGVCFTYGTWFGVEGLMAAGEPSDSPYIQRACQFLLSKQNHEGGWGETFESCSTKQYVQNEETQVVNTAWAVLTLLKAQWPDRRPVDRAVQVLMKRQLPNGNWPQEDIKGVFNANCAISYTAYKNIFPIWALGLYEHTQPQSQKTAKL
ncbi:cycloartenol synthase [Acanthamoeba castellanii str. Neff]|uniref:Terpene cyclase/mutase family member n=1 Tax=Acanthamoeba castellanii (strain ATCC 30010 / Neff) TaxID=1257118 RepID=L8GD76_ACACF|nr:cycloartenol synthase [Acanthamoeba castellanii str. Neff]ELR10814.1 cycloartenol synthase [Acanthamoeba castellanii str. Neff]